MMGLRRQLADHIGPHADMRETRARASSRGHFRGVPIAELHMQRFGNYLEMGEK